MSIEIFQSPSWFFNLWINGFECQPKKYWILRCAENENFNDFYLHLVQPASGSGLISLSNYYSCLFGPEHNSSLCDHSNVLHRACFMRVLRGIPNSEFIKIQPLDPKEKWLIDIRKYFHKNCFYTLKFFCFGNWYHNTSGKEFMHYWTERPSPLRNSVARGKRRLSASGDWRIDVHTPHSHDLLGTLKDAISAYEKVYKNSWKSPEPCVNFIPELVNMAAQQGWLRLGILWFNEQPAAAQLWLVVNGKANIYKLAYVQGLERFSVGSVLTAALMEYVIDIDKVNEIDYLSGDDSYKADWMTQRRERVGIVIFDLKKFKGWYQFSNYLSTKIINRMKKLISLK